MPSILFICTGNLYRSPIAAAAFLQQLKANENTGSWTVRSAGTWTQPRLSPHQDAVRTAREFGLDIESHKTRLVDAQELSSANALFVMEEGHREALLLEFPFLRGKIYLLTELVERIPYDIPDPIKRNVDLKGVVHQICDVIKRGYPVICQLGEPVHSP